MGECEGVRRGKRVKEEEEGIVAKKRRSSSTHTNNQSAHDIATSTCHTPPLGGGGKVGECEGVRKKKRVKEEEELIVAKRRRCEPSSSTQTNNNQSAQDLATPTCHTPPLPLPVDHMCELVVHNNHVTSKPKSPDNRDSAFDRFCTFVDTLTDVFNF